MLQWIFELLTQSIIEGPVNYSPWWVPLAVGAGTGILNSLMNRGDKLKARRRAGQARRRTEEAVDATTDALGRMSSRAEGIREDYSAQELYGPLMQSYSDRIQGTQDTNMQRLLRTAMASGGDISGRHMTIANQLQQTGQENIADVMNRFAEMTTNTNLRNAVRRDQLFGQVASGQQNLASMLAGVESNQQLRADQMGQADKQFFLDMLGIGAQTSGQLKEIGALENIGTTGSTG